jgi:multicomponent Na+:H+ antiporter subunit E
MVRFIAMSAAAALPLAVAWWALVEGRPASWGVGGPVVALAAALAAALRGPARHRVRWGPALRFGGWFLAQSIQGGLDVARRALSPSLPLDAGLVELRTTLPEGAPRVLLADATSLLPGTSTVDLDGDRVLLHGLDVGPGLERDFRALEARVAELFGLERGRA